MKKVKLNFMVVPSQLERFAFVPNRIRCRIINPESAILDSILGESGKRLAKAGIEFYFTNKLAKELIEREIVIKI